jgi:cell division protein FtsA
VLTGGTALVHGLPDLTGEAFQMHTRIGYPVGVGGLIDVIHDPSFATGVGLVLYGFKTQQKAQRKAERWPPGGGWSRGRSDRGLWSRVKKWFREVV